MKRVSVAFFYLFALVGLTFSFQNCAPSSLPEATSADLQLASEDPSFMSPDGAEGTAQAASTNSTRTLQPVPAVAPKKLLVYQGRYEGFATGSTLAQKVQSVAQVMANFDFIVLTHGFTVGPRGTPKLDLTFTYPEYDGTQKPRVAYPTLDAKTDFNGDGRTDIGLLIAKIRELRRNAGKSQPKIFAYVALTADNINQWPQTPYEMAFHSNYLVQHSAGYGNFVKWVNRWITLESQVPGASIDGFFLDMASEVYVHEIALMSMVGYIKSFSSPRRYAIMPNVVSVGDADLRYSGCTLWDSATSKFVHWAAHDITRPLGNGAYPFYSWTPCSKLVNPISTFANLKDLSGNYLMGSGDYFLLEGFPLLQGAYNYGPQGANYLATIPARLNELKRTRGIRWVTVAQEKGYDPNCRATTGTVSNGQTSQSVCQKTQPLVNCSSQNFDTTARFAGTAGADAFFYSEANLGVYSNKAGSFCSKFTWEP